MDKPRGLLLELNFGDDELIIREHEDGKVTLEVADGRLLLEFDQFTRVLMGMAYVSAALKLDRQIMKALRNGWHDDGDRPASERKPKRVRRTQPTIEANE